MNSILNNSFYPPVCKWHWCQCKVGAQVVGYYASVSQGSLVFRIQHALGKTTNLK